MKLSFARKEDETTAFSSTEPSSSPPPHALAIGICDVAGAGVRALKSLTTGGNFGGNQLQKRDFDLKFTGDDGEGLIGKGDSDGDDDQCDDAVHEEDEDDISALERAIFVKTNDDGDDCSSSPVSLVQFVDARTNVIVLSCLAINVMVPERDEASVCNAVVKFVREHLSSCCEKIVFCAAMKLEQGVKGDANADEDVFCFGSEIFENNENVNFTRLDEKTTRVRDGLLKGLISGSRCVFGSRNVSGVVVPGFAVPRVGGSEMEMESGETANKLEKVIGETFKELGVRASGNAKNFRATKTWWKIKEGAKFMPSMFM